MGKGRYLQECWRTSGNAERLRLYEAVIKEFLESGVTKAELARRIGRKPEQITRWLGAPGNWTLDTVSDLLLATLCRRTGGDGDSILFQPRALALKPHLRIPISLWEMSQIVASPTGTRLQRQCIECLKIDRAAATTSRYVCLSRQTSPKGSDHQHDEECISGRG